MKFSSKTVVAFLLGLLILPGVVLAQLTVPQGGTGLNSISNGSIPFKESGTLRLATSSALQFDSSTGKLTITNASTTNTSVSGYFSFNGVTGTSWTDFCETITGGSGLCDGTDDTSAGGGDNVSIDGVAVVDPDFVSTGDIDFVDTSNTITAIINADTIINADLSIDVEAIDGDFLQYDSTGDNFTWRSAAEVKTDLSLDNVENTALSTWTGAATISTLGTISTGVWQGTAITDSYIADTLTIGAGSTIADGLILEPDLSTDVVAVDGDFLQYDSTGTNFTWRDASEMRSDLGLVIGTNVQAYDADLLIYAGITPSANVQSLLGAADYAAMRTLLDLEAGTDFYSISAADAAFEGELNNEAGLYAALSDVTQFWEAGDTLSSGAISSGFGNIDIGSSNLDADGTITSTGIIDFGGATSFELPNSADPTVNATGEIALETASSTLRYYDGTREHVIYPYDVISVTNVASTSVPANGTPSFDTGTSTYKIRNYSVPVTIGNYYCETTAGTLNVHFSDGTNDTDTIVASTSGVEDDGSIANATFNPREDMYIEIGSSASSADGLTCTIEIYITP